MIVLSFVLLIAGTVLWAVESFVTFPGVRYNVSTGWGGSGTSEETPDFKKWNIRNRRISRFGICLVVVGTVIQLAPFLNN